MREVSEVITISLDAMGGDSAPLSEVAGAIDTVKRYDHLNIILVGSEDVISRELAKYSYDKDRIKIHNCSEVIEMHDSPTEALKKKPDSSIVVGLKLLKQNAAQAFISAGNTGAVMAASLLLLGRISNVTRPTIGESFPTDKGLSIVFDVGANMDCKPIHLLEFAIMGVVYANHIFKSENPRVALLSVGEEKTKGDNLTVETYELLEKSHLNFIGNIEGADVLRGKAEVIVCDGFVGNVILKFAESVPAVLKNRVRNYASGNIFRKIRAKIMASGLRQILKDFDYQEYGGVPLLGVNGITIIGHGKSSPKAIQNMILKAERMVRENITEFIQAKIKDIKEFLPKTITN